MKKILAMGLMCALTVSAETEARPMKLIFKGQVFSDDTTATGSQGSFEKFFGGNSFEYDLSYNTDSQSIVMPNPAEIDHLIPSSDIQSSLHLGSRVFSVPTSYGTSVAVDDYLDIDRSAYVAQVEYSSLFTVLRPYTEIQEEEYGVQYYNYLRQGFFSAYGYYPAPLYHYGDVPVYLTDSYASSTYTEADFSGYHNINDGIGSLDGTGSSEVDFSGYVNDPEFFGGGDGYETPAYSYTFEINSSELMALPEPDAWIFFVLGIGAIGGLHRVGRFQLRKSQMI